jgi:hypothetical protein
VDDYIPVNELVPVFSTSKNKDIWVHIIEKVWAKLHGGYERIING